MFEKYKKIKYPDFQAMTFLRICKTLGEDLQGFTRICETLGEDSWGFVRICETLGEDL